MVGRPVLQTNYGYDNRQIENFGKAVWLSLHKIKRVAMPTLKSTQIAAHFILPNRINDENWANL